MHRRVATFSYACSPHIVGISLSYCKGGNEMLVFAVVEPRERQHGCPRDYVVVANNNHQLPLGSVTFKKRAAKPSRVHQTCERI